MARYSCQERKVFSTHSSAVYISVEKGEWDCVKEESLVDVGGAQLLVERFQGNPPYSSCFRGSENSEEPKVVLFEAEKRAVIGDGK